ncbi:hypothetical protein LTR72_007144 [Exophiala xenobiotica]|nr:hypothetical protein LTR72_007144 [Exophiala xenobiotica]KAK5290795.1 hypothetical protein LTR14_006302 [Exophiala xenobiotica]KAK5497456.1 hypothetical protein LTR55_001948 [Exophiala xenobiotica]
MVSSFDGIDDDLIPPDAGLQFPLGFSVADFASTIITLEVGPEATIMTAHRAILTRSDYFAKCLQNFKEGVQNKVKLPEDSPADILRILCFLYTGKMFEGDTGDQCRSPDRNWTTQGVTDLISIYITADKYCVTDMSSGVIYRICNVPVKSFDLSHLQQFNDAGLGDCTMSRYIIANIAYSAIGDPKRLRMMLDKEVDLDPELGLKLLKRITTHMEEQNQSW